MVRVEENGDVHGSGGDDNGNGNGNGNGESGGGGGGGGGGDGRDGGDNRDNRDSHDRNDHRNDHSADGYDGDELEPEQFRKMFIGGLTSTTSDDALREFYSQWGNLLDCVVMRDPTTKKSRGFGFVTFSKQSEVDEAMSHRPHVIDGKSVDPKRAVPREHSQKNEANLSSKRLYVSGVREEHTEQMLTEYFGKYGTILKTEIIADKNTGKPRGFAFITFDDYDSVDKCVLIRSHQINNSRCDVKKALSKEEMARAQQHERERMERGMRTRGPPMGRGGGGWGAPYGGAERGGAGGGYGGPPWAGPGGSAGPQGGYGYGAGAAGQWGPAGGYGGGGGYGGAYGGPSPAAADDGWSSQRGAGAWNQAAPAEWTGPGAGGAGAGAGAAAAAGGVGGGGAWSGRNYQ